MHMQAKIQKWGNGLALRVSGAMREIPHFAEGTQVDVEITETGWIVKKIEKQPKKKLPYAEDDLLHGLTPQTAHADELASLFPHEMGE